MLTLADLPPGLYHSLVIIGTLGLIASFLVKFIPFIYRYLVLIQILSVLMIAFGLYYSGVAANEAKWQLEARLLKEKVLIAEKHAQEVTSKVEYIFVDRVQKVKDVQFIIQERIRDIAVSIDSQCRITPDALDIVNSAAKNIKPEAKK